MNQPLVSCIVPTYNGAAYLAEALDSIFAQTYPHLEVVIADDGSTDATLAIAARYGSRIRVVRQPNAGPASARNLGVATSAGAFLAFLDQDDIWHPEKIVRQMGRFEVRRELGLSVAHVQRFWTAGLTAQEDRFREHRAAKPLPGYITGTFLMRRSAFDAAGPFDPAVRFADSMEWFGRARAAGVVCELLQDVLLRHRMHGGNLSQAEADGSRDEFLRLLKAGLDRKRADAKLRST